jgi:hypothetical protein
MLDVSEHLEEWIGTWAGAEFAPDRKAVAYTIRENGVDNIWMQPLDGSMGHQITNFKSEQISLSYCHRTGRSSAYYAGTQILMWFSCKNLNSRAP